MFEFEPGPIEISEAPLWEPLFDRGRFASHAYDFAESRSGMEAQIVTAAIDVAGDGIPDEAGAHASILGPAEEANAHEVSSGGEPLPETSISAGEVINEHAAKVAPHLPPPDGDVPMNFGDPPALNLSAGVAVDDGDEPNRGRK